MEKPSFFPSLFQPSRPISFFFFSPFSSFPRPRKPSRRPVPFPSPFSSLRPKTIPRRPISFPRPAPPPLSHHQCHAGPARQGLLLSRVRRGLETESGLGTPRRGLLLARTRRLHAPAYKRRRPHPGTLPSRLRCFRFAQTLATAAAIVGVRRSSAESPFHHLPDDLEPHGGSHQGSEPCGLVLSLLLVLFARASSPAPPFRHAPPQACSARLGPAQTPQMSSRGRARAPRACHARFRAPDGRFGQVRPSRRRAPPPSFAAGRSAPPPFAPISPGRRILIRRPRLDSTRVKPNPYRSIVVLLQKSPSIL